MEDKLRILKIDVDRNMELAYKYNIRSIPTLMLFQDGRTKWSGTGVVTSDYLENVINNNCYIITN
ncbi:MAG: thioredoxin family protein [Bacteroidales bacterium]|nr:thioredoxin family protein [Bacteroidales bacterium]